MIDDELILIDNFLTDDEILNIKKEITLSKNLIEPDKDIMNDTSYLRFFIDSRYDNREDSHILTAIDNNLFSSKTIDLIKQKESLAFQLYNCTSKHETQLTIYTNGGKYTWHRDSGSKRIISFVLPIDLVKKEYTGGELIIKHKSEEITITPKHNQLIMFSSQLLHKVNEVKVDSRDIFKGRTVINGHIGFRV